MASGRSRSRYAETGAALFALVATAAHAQAPAVKRVEQPIRGVVRAVEQALISTDLATRVAAIHTREGESFKAGQTLLEFDCRRQRATAAAADAQQLEMQLTVDKNRLLMRTQSVGKNDLDIAEARLAKAKAEADSLRSPLEQCSVVAPFDGRVTELSLQVHETSQPGKPFMGLIAGGRLEIDLIAPSHWVARLSPGIAFDFHVDDVRQTVRASVARIGAAVDPVSQTIKVIARVEAGADVILPGMSGTSRFATGGE